VIAAAHLETGKNPVLSQGMAATMMMPSNRAVPLIFP
jgi:hypothetical protein